jgi:hypothetical protein
MRRTGSEDALACSSSLQLSRSPCTGKVQEGNGKPTENGMMELGRYRVVAAVSGKIRAKSIQPHFFRIFCHVVCLICSGSKPRHGKDHHGSWRFGRADPSVSSLARLVLVRNATCWRCFLFVSLKKNSNEESKAVERRRKSEGNKNHDGSVQQQQQQQQQQAGCRRRGCSRRRTRRTAATFAAAVFASIGVRTIAQRHRDVGVQVAAAAPSGPEPGAQHDRRAGRGDAVQLCHAGRIDGKQDVDKNRRRKVPVQGK